MTSSSGSKKEMALLAACVRNESLLESMSETVLDELVDDVTIGLAFEIHRAVKTGTFAILDGNEHSAAGADMPEFKGSNAVDVFGQAVWTASGVPTLKKQPECVCPNCQRNLAASRFAPHLEKCMGMGRNSSRLASRRLANNSKAGGGEEGDDAEDEDWIEPGKGPVRRKRDKNSPRRSRNQRSNTPKWRTPEEEAHVDIDSLTEGDTAALRESLAQLSNASSPAESTISTSSNPSMSLYHAHRGRRDKGRRGATKKAKSSSKNGSRGSTPPLCFD